MSRQISDHGFVELLKIFIDLDVGKMFGILDLDVKKFYICKRMQCFFRLKAPPFFENFVSRILHM
jgi:hypothetical protein